MFIRSATDTSTESRSRVFNSATDSPVSAASSILRLAVSISLASAATLSPVLKTITSPGTNSRDGCIDSSPARMTADIGAIICFKACMARSARYCCTKPRRTEIRTTTTMMMGSQTLPFSSTRAMTSEIAAAASRMMMRTFLNCPSSISHQETVFSLRSSFGPNCSQSLPRLFKAQAVLARSQRPQRFVDAKTVPVALFHVYHTPLPTLC